MSAEYRERNLFRYHGAQAELSDGYGVLARFSDAEAALKEANGTLARIRSHKAWPQWGAAISRHNARVNAVFLERQGRHVEAEQRRRGALQEAQKHLQDMTRTQQGGDNQFVRNAVRVVAGSKVELADNLATQGKYGEAESYARAGLEDQLAIYGVNTAQVGYALGVVGWTRFQQGDIAAAERYYRRALGALVDSGVAAHSISLANRRAALGNAMLVQGRWQDANTEFQERDKGLRADPEQFKRHGSGHVSWVLARLKIGRAKDAADQAQRILDNHLARPAPNRVYIAQLRGVQAAALAALGNNDAALKLFQESIPELTRRDAKAEQAEDTGYWRAFWLRTILEYYLDLLAGLHAAGAAPAGLDASEEAFRMADLARGSSVQEAISASAARAHLPDGQLAELARRYQDTSNRIGALSQLLGRLAQARETDQFGKVMSDMRAEIERLRQEQTALSAELRKRFPEYADLVDPRPVGYAEVRKALAPDEALVSIYLGATRSYVWTIGAGGKSAMRIVAVGREEIEADVGRLRAATDFGDGAMARLPAFDLARAHKLYRLFLASDEALWQDAKVLNVIPHGPLGQLPFSLLVTAPPPSQPGPGPQAAYRDAAWLARKVAVAQLPSANALSALRRAPAPKGQRRAFIGFGDPVFAQGGSAGSERGLVRNLVLTRATDGTADRVNDALKGARLREGPENPVVSLASAFGQLSPLPDTADELKQIAAALKADQSGDVFVGRQASERIVKSMRLDDRRIVAFATHGIAPGELTGLDQPALALANPALSGDANEDGFLTMQEILALRLDADWVVLSACNTGSADGRGGEAVSGLGRAFFYAGARSMLVSNWAVETTSARLLTTELFRRQAENPGLARAEALRLSMLSLMEKNADGGGFSYAHPAFWAPFSLIGDSGARAAR
jgi:CHAT domain-containing protein